MFLFEFPQNIIGYIAFVICTKGFGCPYYKYQEAYATRVRGSWGGISLSRFILWMIIIIDQK